jgi:hypothetical protein
VEAPAFHEVEHRQRRFDTWTAPGSVDAVCLGGSSIPRGRQAEAFLAADRTRDLAFGNTMTSESALSSLTLREWSLAGKQCVGTCPT